MGDELENFDNCPILEELYNVEKILDKKKYKNQWKYKVKWEGYSYDECTWEPIENLDVCQELIEKFDKDYEFKMGKKLKHEKKENKSKEINIAKVNTEELYDDESDKKIKKMKLVEDDVADELTIASESNNMCSLKTTEELVVPPPEGNLDEDIPIKIEMARIIDDIKIELNCLVTWRERRDGVIPTNTWISSNIVRIRNPELLLKFYENKIKFPNFNKDNYNK